MKFKYKPEDFYSANHWGKDGPTDQFFDGITAIANAKLKEWFGDSVIEIDKLIECNKVLMDGIEFYECANNYHAGNDSTCKEVDCVINDKGKMAREILQKCKEILG